MDDGDHHPYLDDAVPRIFSIPRDDDAGPPAPPPARPRRRHDRSRDDEQPDEPRKTGRRPNDYLRLSDRHQRTTRGFRRAEGVCNKLHEQYSMMATDTLVLAAAENDTVWAYASPRFRPLLSNPLFIEAFLRARSDPAQAGATPSEEDRMARVDPRTYAIPRRAGPYEVANVEPRPLYDTTKRSDVRQGDDTIAPRDVFVRLHLAPSGAAAATPTWNPLAAPPPSAEAIELAPIATAAEMAAANRKKPADAPPSRRKSGGKRRRCAPADDLEREIMEQLQAAEDHEAGVPSSLPPEGVQVALRVSEPGDPTVLRLLAAWQERAPPPSGEQMARRAELASAFCQFAVYVECAVVPGA